MYRSLKWLFIGLLPVAWAVGFAIGIWTSSVGPGHSAKTFAALCVLIATLGGVGGYIAGRKSVIPGRRSRKSAAIERRLFVRDLGMIAFLQLSLVIGWWLGVDIEALRYTEIHVIDRLLRVSVVAGLIGWVTMVVVSRGACPACGLRVFQAHRAWSIDYIARGCVHCGVDAEFGPRDTLAPMSTNGAPHAPTNTPPGSWHSPS
jgi:hypothetical protein